MSLVGKAKVLGFGALLALDCFGNVCVGGAFKRTLSATAWSVRNHPFDYWWYGCINKLFADPNHCKNAWEHENSPTFVSRWVEWRAQLKAA